MHGGEEGRGSNDQGEGEMGGFHGMSFINPGTSLAQ